MFPPYQIRFNVIRARSRGSFRRGHHVRLAFDVKWLRWHGDLLKRIASMLRVCVHHDANVAALSVLSVFRSTGPSKVQKKARARAPEENRQLKPFAYAVAAAPAK